MSSFPSCRVDFSTATQRHPSANVGTKAEPKLDGKHVVFGRVIEGIDKLSKAPVCIAKMAWKETSCLIKYSSNKSILKLTAKISYQFTIHPFQSISHFLTLHPISNRHGDFSSALNSSNLWVQKEALHSSRRSLKQHRLSKIIEKHDERVWKTCKYISIEKNIYHSHCTRRAEGDRFLMPTFKICQTYEGLNLTRSDHELWSID